MRSPNPALSLSSIHEDEVDNRRKGYGEPFETLSPRTTISLDEISDTSDGRSQSAPPPAPTQTSETMRGNTEILSATFDPRQHRSEGSHCTVREANIPRGGDGQTLQETRKYDSSVGIGTMQLQHHDDGVGSGGTTLLVPSLSGKSVGKSPTRASNDNILLSQRVHGRELSRPVARSAKQISYQQHGGGILVVRPNPVKPTELKTTPLPQAGFAHAAAATAAVEEPLHHPTVERVAPIKAVVPLYPLPERSGEGTKLLDTPAEENKANEAWCIAVTSENEKEIKRKNKEANKQKRDHLQVNFPENHTAMPSAGRNSVAGDDYGEGRHPQSQRHPQNGDDPNRIRQTQQQNHRDRMNSLRASSGASSLGNRNRNEDVNEAVTSRTAQPTPLFERLVTEEVQELKTYANIVERQNLELAKQKKVQEDLETRLKSETKRRKELESMLEEQERLWSEKFIQLEEERRKAEKKLKDEESKTKKLINQVQRKDRDIHEFFKKKVRACLGEMDLLLNISFCCRTYCSHPLSYFYFEVRSRRYALDSSWHARRHRIGR